MLLGITVWVNFIGLMLVLWLGLYLVTQTTRNPQAWLSALAFWSTGGIFLNQLLALHPPAPPPFEVKIWVYHLILFWPRNVFELGWRGWLQGWLPAYGMAFWYHATLSMRPGKFKQPILMAWPGYIFALAGILLKTRYPEPWMDPAASPLSTNPLPGFIFAFDVTGLVIFAGLSLFNLSKAEDRSGGTISGQNFRFVLIATLAAGAAGLLGFSSNLLGRPAPQVWAAALLSLALFLGGIGVSGHLASPERVRPKRDFFYSAGQAAVFMAVAWLVLRIITHSYPVPFMSLVSIECLVLIVFMLVGVSHLRLHQLPIFRASQQLGASLPDLFVRRKNANGAMGQALRQLVDVTDATWVIVLRFSEGSLQPAGSWNWKGESLEDIYTGSPPGGRHEERLALHDQVSPPFEQAALILPLYHQEQEQAGVLLAGAPRKQAEYNPSQLSAFHDAMKIFAGLVGEAGDGKGEGLPITSSSASSIEEVARHNEPIPARQVELALRNLHNYAYLADLPLADLRLVRDCSDSLEMGMNSFVQRGKALSSVLEEAVFRLKPDHGDPPETPSRSWYPYLILRKAYLEGLSNRAVMAQLYISEGTFNRTRRAAIQSVARILEEMEAGPVDGNIRRL